MNAPAPKVKGVVCPTCSGPMRTVKTIHLPDRTTRRDKRCQDSKCGFRGYSFERLPRPTEGVGR